MTFAKSLARTALVAGLLLATPFGARAQGAGQWADKDDPVAKQLIALERTWALLACDAGPDRAATAEAFYREYMADDFVGTSPEGPLYTKADLIPAKAAEPETGCTLLDAKVRFFGPDLAVIYGRETARTKTADGKTGTRPLIWTDTLLRRGGKWQFIAVQDMADPSK
jgi:hypothetical protein